MTPDEAKKALEELKAMALSAALLEQLARDFLGFAEQGKPPDLRTIEWARRMLGTSVKAKP